MNKPWLSKGSNCLSHDSHSLLPVPAAYLCVYSVNVDKDNMEAMPMSLLVCLKIANHWARLVARERDQEEMESGGLRPDVGQLELRGPSHGSGSVPMRSLSHFFIPRGEQSVCSDTR